MPLPNLDFFRSILGDDFKEKAKEQEREAIKALVAAAKAEILLEKAAITMELQTASVEMKLVATSYATNIEGGLSGATADAARQHLLGLPTPSFESPIK